MFSILLGIYLEVELLGHMVTLTFLRTTKFFSKVFALFYIPPAMPPNPHQHFLLSVFFITAILVGMKWYLIVILIYIFLMTNNVE